MTKSRSNYKKTLIMFKCIEWKAITSNDLINYLLILGYIFKASGDIEIGEDFFMDCNRS
jgi:hypothetical protein